MDRPPLIAHENAPPAARDAIGALSRLACERTLDVRQMSRSAETTAPHEDPAARSLHQGFGWHPPGLGRVGHWPGGGQGSQLAHPPRVRVGKPGVDALDSVLLGTWPLRPVRRARLRHERMAGRRPDAGSMGRGSRGGHRGGRTRRAGDAARHLAGRRYLHPLCGPASGTRGTADSLRRLRPRGATGAGRPPRRRRTAPWWSWRGLPGQKTTRRSGRCSHRASFPAAPRAAGVVQRSMLEDHHRRGRGGAAGGARATWTSTALLAGSARRHWFFTRANDEVVPIAEGRLLASGIPGAEFVELDSRNHILLEQEPAWQRFCEAVLAFLRAEGHGRATRRSRRCRHASVRCWR